MNEAKSIYAPEVLEMVDMFVLPYADLRLHVIYTYYDALEDPLYVGGSRDFYTAHFLNAQRLPFFSQIEYVGFVFLVFEDILNEAKKYYIRARRPKYNHGRYQNLPYIKGCGVHTDELVVNVRDMEQRWREELYSDDGEGARYLAELDAEVLAEIRKEHRTDRAWPEVDWEGKF